MSADHFGPHEAREAGEALPGLTSRVVIYTTAPRDYDWQFTRELDANVGIASNGKVIRKVEIETSRAEHQCQRYANEHADGHHEIVQCAACPDCAVAISWLVQVGAVVATGASGVDVSFVLRIEEEEYEGTATLIPRRDGRQGYEAAGSSPDYWLDVAFWSRFRSLTDAHSRYREIERDVLQAIAGECAVVAGAAAS